jgi:hypothetical protein
MPHLEVLLVVNDDRVVIEDKSFDYLIKLKDKYGKYAVVYQLQNLIHLNECKYKTCSSYEIQNGYISFVNSYIQRTAGEVVEEITEIPTTPPPRIQERTVVEPAGPPQIVKRTIRVPPRGGAYGGYQPQQQQQQQQGASYQPQQQQQQQGAIYQPQQQQQQQGASFQSGDNLLGAASYSSISQSTGSYQQGASFQAGGNLLGAANYGNIPQATSSYQQQSVSFPVGGNLLGAVNYGNIPQANSSYQQQAGVAYSGGYGAYGGGAYGGGAYGGGYQQHQPVQAPIVFSVGGPGQSSQPLPPVGCHPAFCFYV